MDSRKIKPRKMKVAVKKSRVQILLDLFFRVMEIIVVLITVAKLGYQLVITFQSSGLAGLLINRHVAFVLGNAIVIAILVKCGFFANQEPDSQRNSSDFYDEFVRASSRGERSLSLQTDVICREKQSEAEDQNRAKQISDEKGQSMVVKQGTEDKREKHKTTENSGEDMEKKDITVKRQRQSTIQNQDSARQSYERSPSENLARSNKSSYGRLKRSETQRSGDAFVSDDELRYKIESFIARQRRNQKDEQNTL